jgi:hypothetical protein
MEDDNGSTSLAARVAKGVAFFGVTTFFVVLGAGGSLYLWHASRLHNVWQEELAEARGQGRLTEDEYIAQAQARSYARALMSPSKVWKKVTEKGVLHLSK